MTQTIRVEIVPIRVTAATASDTTLVVCREDRYYQATDQLPQEYQRRIEGIEGVVSVTLMKVHRRGGVPQRAPGNIPEKNRQASGTH